MGRDIEWAHRQVGHTKDSDDRPDNDHYITPPEAIYPLVIEENFTFPWEPAVGTGVIANILDEHGYCTLRSDIMTGVNFLEDQPPGEFVDIITNPPYNQALGFIEKGLTYLYETGGKMALLLRLAFLEGIRKGLYQKHPPTRVRIFSRRIPRMHRASYTGKKSSSLIAFAWFIWEAKIPEITSIHWFDWKDYNNGSGAID